MSHLNAVTLYIYIHMYIHNTFVFLRLSPSSPSLFIPPLDRNAGFHASCSPDSYSSQPVEEPTEETSMALNQASGLVKGNHMCS